MKWVRHIRDHCDAPPDVRALLLVLATYADGDGLCWPSLETVARNLGITTKAAKARRNRAVALGWLVIRSPGRWKGASTRYVIQSKGEVDAPLSIAQRGKSMGAKGGSGRSSKGVVDDPRTTKKFHEGDNGAPSMEARSSPIEERRRLARTIREAPNPSLRSRYRATFLKKYGHLYPLPHDPGQAPEPLGLTFLDIPAGDTR